MAFIPPKDRVLETSTSNSQTVFSLAGAADTSYNAFSASMTVGDTTIGCVVEPGVAFRSGILTYSAANQITVTTTKESKGTFSSSGTKEVFMGEPASLRDASPIFCFEGDSLTDTTSHGTWPLSLITNSAFFARGTNHYFAVGGETAATMVGEYASEAGAVSLAGAEAYYFLWAGTNDISLGSLGVPTAATIYGYLTTMWAAARTSGYKVVAFTIMARGDLDATQEGIRVALNLLIRSNSALYDYLIRTDVLLPNVSDTSNFRDLVHLTPAGNNLLANAVIGTILGAASVPAAPLDAMAYNGLQMNGSCEVDQEHAGALVSGINGASSFSILDGWRVAATGTMVLAAQQVTDAPLGLTNSLKITVTTGQAVLGASDFAVAFHKVEGYRSSRLAFGNANAQPISFGFWTKIHRAGTYGGSVRNIAINRSWPFSFTQNAADVWEYKSVTVYGDVTGTWVGNSNQAGLFITFSLGDGSSFQGTANAWVAADRHTATGQINGVAATSDIFQITGLHIIPGLDLPPSTHAPLVMRPFDQELVLAQRYWEASYDYGSIPGAVTANGVLSGVAISTTTVFGSFRNQIPKRDVPSVTLYSANGTSGKITDATTGLDTAAASASGIGTNGFSSITSSGLTSGRVYYGHFVANARF